MSEEISDGHFIGKSKKLENICYMGGSQAGVVGLLSLLSKGYHVFSAVSYLESLTHILKDLGIPTYSTIKHDDFIKDLTKADILVSVHGREVLNSNQLNSPKFGCINVHPYLYAYKGASPVKRAFEEGNFKASVGVHKMTTEIDGGEVITEDFIDVSGVKTPEEIYNKLYPYYCIGLFKALNIITKKG